MVGLSNAPQGDSKPVDHKKSMEKAAEQWLEGKKKPYVNEEALKQLEGKELKVATNWRDMDVARRNLVTDGLIGIQDKLAKGELVDPKQLEGFMILKDVLPKVFGTTIDNVMSLRRGQLEAQRREAEGFAEAEKAIEGYEPEAEGPAGTLDGMSQDELFKKPE